MEKDVREGWRREYEGDGERSKGKEGGRWDGRKKKEVMER